MRVQLLLVTLSASAAMYARTTVSPLQETMRLALCLSDNQMALLQGPALGLPLVLAAVPLGLLIDRHSRARLLVIFTVLNMVGTLFTAFAANFALLFASRCLIGLTSTATGSAAFSLLGDLCSPTHRGRATMIVVVGQYGGIAAAFAAAGSLLALSGSGPDAWRWAIFLLSLPLVPVIFLLFGMREPPRIGVAAAEPTKRKVFVELWRYRAVIAPLLVGLTLVEIALQASLVWAAPALSRTFLLEPHHMGTIMATGLLVSGTLGPVAGGLLADISQRAGGPRRTMAVLSATALLTLVAGLFAVAPGLVSASILLVMFMTIVSTLVVMGTTLLTIVVPNELRGLCITLFAAAVLVFGTGAAPLLVSLLSGAIGGPAMIGKALALVGVVSCVLGALAFAFGRRFLLPCDAHH